MASNPLLRLVLSLLPDPYPWAPSVRVPSNVLEEPNALLLQLGSSSRAESSMLPVAMILNAQQTLATMACAMAF
jgi:hypothetical protein